MHAPIDADGTAYFGSEDGYVYAVKSNGVKKWSLATSFQVDLSPAIGSDGTIYFGSDSGIFCAIK